MMRLKRFGLSACLAMLLAAPATLAGDLEGHIARPLADLNFQTLGEGPLEIAVLSGDPRTGPSAFMLKFPPNFPGGMHVHTHGYHGVVISGASKHWVEGESEADAPLQRPGDYWYQAGGQLHQDSFPTDEPTIIYLQFEGPQDTRYPE